MSGADASHTKIANGSGAMGLTKNGVGMIALRTPKMTSDATDHTAAQARKRPSIVRAAAWASASTRSADIGPLLVAPGEALADGHREDDRVALGQGMASGIARLRLAAADMATGGAQPEVEAAAALLAGGAGRFGDRLRDVWTGGLRAAERSKQIHIRIVRPIRLPLM